MPSLNISDLSIESIPVAKLKPYENNARTHSSKQTQQIANSIKEFGFINPIIIDDNNYIMAGHGRMAAAKKLGLKEVPTIRRSNLSDAQIKAYILADNKIAANAGWDKEILAIELQHLSLDSDLEIETTGFEMAEIDLLIDGLNINAPDEDDVIPESLDELPVTQPGDCWMLGQHVLYCGDATKRESYEHILGKDKVRAVFTDPPYNVAIDRHVCGKGAIKHREFAMASGEMSNSEYADFLHRSLTFMHDYSDDGSLHYICMDWRHIDTLLRVGKSVYTSHHNLCVWNKDNGGMGSMYRSKHELIAVFKHGTKAHINNIELGKHGRYRTNVWDYAGVNSFGGRQSDLKMHPTVKPVALVADAIKDCTKRGDSVLDPFAGSGTTLIAAERTDRIAYCIELDPHYCDVIIRRWQNMTEQEAVHLDSFNAFNERAEL